MASEYWDTCLFLTYLQNKSEEQELVGIISALLRRAESGDTLIVVSTLVLAELRPLRAYESRHSEVIWDLFYTNRPYLRLVSLSPRLAQEAGAIGSGYKLTSPDAVHVATALSERVNVMYTQDGAADKERRRSGQLLFYDGKIGTPPLKIKMPMRPPDSQIEMPERTLP